MTKSRTAIPTKTADAVLREYNHRCAICGKDRPHLHHIDEDPANNAHINLLPLCPNCHLSDQHNPTHRIDTAKLQLFRVHKDPGILRPQFHPVFRRQEFLASVELNDEPVGDLERQAKELIEIVAALEMGAFYSKRLSELIAPLPHAPYIGIVDSGFTAAYKEEQRKRSSKYRSQLRDSLPTVQALLVEQLRFQPWANEA